MKADNNRGNRAGGARELLTTGAIVLDGAMKAANNRGSGAGGVREAVNNRSNSIRGGHEGC